MQYVAEIIVINADDGRTTVLLLGKCGWSNVILVISPQKILTLREGVHYRLVVH